MPDPVSASVISEALCPFADTWPFSRISPGRNSRDVVIDDLIRELHQSLEITGQLQPLGVIDRPEDNLIYGFRRFTAMGLGWDRPVSVLVFPDTITLAQILTIQATENLQRVDLTDPETFKLCQELVKINGWSHGEVARHLGKSNGTITRYLSPSKLIPEALEAFLAGEFGLDTSYTISKSEYQAETLRVIQGGGSRDEARKSAKQKPKTLVRSSSIKCPLPTGSKVTITGAELSLEEAMEVLEEAKKALKDGIKRGYTAATFNRARKDMAAN